MIANFLLFQIGWFASVLGAAHQAPWLGVLIVCLVLVVHLTKRATRGEASLIFVAAALGCFVDSLLAVTGIVSYGSHVPFSSFAPAWIVAMWANFAITLRHSLAWLSRRRATAALAGAVFGPLAYLGAQQLGAARLVEPILAALVLAAVWGAAIPLLFWISTLLERIADRGDGAVRG